MSNELTIWSDNKLTDIKKLFAPALTSNEFETFVWIWKATWLNPFLREIWAVKFGSKPASIFIGRDGYRKSAQANKEYDYHIVDAVYENDDFLVRNWEVEHTYNFKNRWALIWAYCLVKRKSSSKAMFTFAELSEYNTWQSIWAAKPATMIKKVAEAQGLRWAFQELFAWTYEESEEVIEEVQPQISEAEQKKNFESFEEKMTCVKNLEELQKVFVDLNKERKKNKDFINKAQLDELINLKDTIKEKFEVQIVDWEISEVEIEKIEDIANTRTWD